MGSWMCRPVWWCVCPDRFRRPSHCHEGRPKDFPPGTPGAHRSCTSPPPLGLELPELDQALALCEALNLPLNRRQLEVLKDVARRVQKRHARMRVGSPALQD